MKSNLIKFIIGKNNKRKIINKAKFSNKLGSVLLNPLHEYKRKEDNLNIKPTLFLDGKIAVNINFTSNVKELNDFLENIYFNFDLYLSKNNKITRKKLYYLDNIYYENLLDKKNNLKDYKYIINIENEEVLTKLQTGFLESTLTLLQNNIDLIYIGNSKKNISKNNYREAAIELSEKEEIATLERIMSDNTNIEFLILSTKLLTNERIEKINSNTKDIFYKYLKNISNNTMLFKTEFEYIQKNNYNKYFEHNYNEFLNELLKYETITFDIFDTLVTRTVLEPDDIFHLIEKNCQIKMPESFISIRKRAEQEAHKELNKDVSLDEIYDSMKKLNILKAKDVEKLKQLEIEYELEHIIPRYDMLKIYNELLKNNKKIDIISDMYLPEKIIVQILEKNQIKGYRKLYISNEINMRKDTGILWDMYFENNKENTIHIGDNYYSDYFQVIKRNRKALKILNSQEMMNRYSIKNEKDINIRQELATIYNKILFNSPFLKKEDIENNLTEYGKKLLSPIFYTFFDWFTNNNKQEKILFISREGYYLKQIYEKYCELFNEKQQENIYFYASRRAVTIASAKTEKDLLKLLELEYMGTLKSFFENRYGIALNNLNNEVISLPNDIEKVKSIVIKNKKTILENAKKERTNYLKYINTVCPDIKDNNYAIVDLGYSGTTQYYLSKLLGLKISGYYFALTNKKSPEKLGCTINGCFNVDKSIIDENNNFYRKSLYLESFLSAPDGQLIKFKNNKPLFKDSTFNRNRIKELDLIYEGIIKQMHFYKEENIKPFNIKTINAHYNFVCEFLNNCQGELEKVLCIDDTYCRDGNVANKINTII